MYIKGGLKPILECDESGGKCCIYIKGGLKPILGCDESGGK